MWTYKEAKEFPPEQHGEMILMALALLEGGFSIQVCDGSGWYPNFYPDDSYTTPNGRAETGGRDYLKQHAGLVANFTWRLSVYEEGKDDSMTELKNLGRRVSLIDDDPRDCVDHQHTALTQYYDVLGNCNHPDREGGSCAPKMCPRWNWFPLDPPVRV